EREPPGLVDLDGDLVVRAADAPGLHLEHRLHVLDRLLERLEGVVLGLVAHGIERPVEDPLGGRLLAALHDGVDELRHERGLVDRVCQDLALDDDSPSRHLRSPHGAARGHFGRFAPYFERAWRRPSTPTESKVPRITW